MQPASPSPAQDSPALTAGEAMRLGAERLRKAGVESARLDMSLIMAEALGTDRLGLYMDLERPLDAAERGKARAMLARRVAREPMAYILGRREFYALLFKVTPATLIPRPETEHLVETALAWLNARETTHPAPRLADIGTGSGAIAVALAHACSHAQLEAVDISPAALAVARENAQQHGVAERITFHAGSCYAPLSEPVDVIVSNPPYIPARDLATLAPEVAAHEPHAALFSGDDGLDCIRTLVFEAPQHLRPGGLLALECGAGQAPAICTLIAQTGAFEPAGTVPDLAGIPRVVAAQLKPFGSNQSQPWEPVV